MKAPSVEKNINSSRFFKSNAKMIYLGPENILDVYGMVLLGACSKQQEIDFFLK